MQKIIDGMQKNKKIHKSYYKFENPLQSDVLNSCFNVVLWCASVTV